ncbi:MAG: TIGR04282 family arsenosugar biosynthesis glycosyltransferase [Sphingomonadales bacterium]|nr:TIGR04282 family arsenosugar biosynthesis glycosyltransferase [Sphingomonadales bacterium]
MTRILIFAKAPVPGMVKTRLIPALGAEGAAGLAAEMLHRTVREALESDVGAVELCADPAPDHSDWMAQILLDLIVTAQGSGDLGERLARAARRVIAGGEPVLLIGTDCPGLDRHRLAAAAVALERHDAVVHPTHDGGYALLGLARFDPSLFEGIAWSTSSVAAETIARVHALGWSLHLGETLRDIDVPADLP